jgi:hypothetical protein
VSALKFDDGKLPWDLLPTDALRGVVRVLAFGAGKYGRHNWANGMNWSRLYAATFRHLTAWYEGEKTDPETGCSHLSHALCCLLFLAAYEVRGVGRDDRPSAAHREDETTTFNEAVHALR